MKTVHLAIVFAVLLAGFDVLAVEEQLLGETDAGVDESPTDVEALLLRIEQLEDKVGRLTEEAEEDELAQLVAEAEAEAKAPEEEGRPEEREFLWGALALQKLNPEISFSADLLLGLVWDEDGEFFNDPEDRSGLGVREVGLHFQHVLDPYTMFKSSLNFIPTPGIEVELEEIYITWFGIIPSLSLSVGRARQSFGVVNRWHGHDLDQTGYPMAMTQVLGDGGLNANGFVIKWFMPPLIAHANELTIEVTNAENETVLAGEDFGYPSFLAHLKNYYDLNQDTYLEVGLSGLWGTNHKLGLVDSSNQVVDEGFRQTWIAGADLTLQWSPLQRAKYRSFTWRSEGYFVQKDTTDLPLDVAAGLAEDDGERISWGAYSYVDVQLAERWYLGVRGDVALPTIRVKDELAWDVVPYLTFWQSEFVYLRLEYQHGRRIPYTRPDDTLGLKTDNRVLLQIDFAAGPHKHEKY